MAEHDPLSGVSVFVAVARAGSFTAAAQRLGLTKSAVGKSIARLEERVGFKLFHRTTRLMRLTSDGQAYLASCVTAIDEISATQMSLASGNRVLSGRLHIDMPVAFGRRVLLPILIAMTHKHPGLSLSLNFTDATSDLLHDDVDLAIRFGELKDSSNLIARHLVDQPRVICASPAYLRDHGRPQSLADLRGHSCIVGTPKGPPRAWVVREHGTERRILPPPTHQLGDGEAMVDAALGGLGLCQLPLSLVRAHLEQRSLESVLEDHRASPVAVHALWPRQAQLKPRVRYLVDELIAAAARGVLN